MRFALAGCAALCAVFVSGCASSISPVYTKSDSFDEPGLAGTWASIKPDDHDQVRIEKRNGRYTITLTDAKENTESDYETHLFNLKGTTFADLLIVQVRRGSEELELPTGAVALHQIVKYKLDGDDLFISAIDGDAFEKASKTPGFGLEFRSTKYEGGDAVITSPTEKIREYLAAHPSDIFGEMDHLKRKR